MIHFPTAYFNRSKQAPTLWQSETLTIWLTLSSRLCRGYYLEKYNLLSTNEQFVDWQVGGKQTHLYVFITQTVMVGIPVSKNKCTHSNAQAHKRSFNHSSTPSNSHSAEHTHSAWQPANSYTTNQSFFRFCRFCLSPLLLFSD